MIDDNDLTIKLLKPLLGLSIFFYVLLVLNFKYNRYVNIEKDAFTH